MTDVLIRDAPDDVVSAIAATAELAGLAVPHGDKDFDLIADRSGQRLERLALDE